MSRRIRGVSFIVVVVALLGLIVPAVAGGAKEAAGAGRAPEIQPAWRAELDGPIAWHRVTHLGHLVAATDGGLYGLDAATGRVAWKHAALGGMSKWGFQEIPHTPLIAVGEGYRKNWVVILDAGDGRIVFDSRAAGFGTVHGYAALPRSGGLLVAGFKANDSAIQIARIDIATAREQWANARIVGGGKAFAAGLGRATHALAGRAEFPLDPLEVDDGSVVLSTSPGLHRIDLKTGEALWSEFRLEGDRNVRVFFNPKRPDRVYVGAEMVRAGAVLTAGATAYYNAFRLADGARLWRQPAMVSGPVADPIFLDAGMLIGPGPQPGGGTLRLIDEATGASLWGPKGRGVNLPGGLIGHALLPAGLVVTTGTDPVWNRKGAACFLNVLDPATGAPRLARPLPVKGPLLRAEMVPAGILYVTTGELGILDRKSGKVATGSRLVSETVLATVRHGERLYAFAPEAGTLSAVDLRDGAMRTLGAAPVRLEDGDVPLVLEARDDGLVLLGRWNVAAFGLDGTLRHRTHHRAPRRPLALAALERDRAIGAAMRALQAGAADCAFARAAVEEPGSLGRALVATRPGGLGGPGPAYGGGAGAYAAAARARFSGAAASHDHAVMLVELPGDGYGLARVGKATGAIAGVVSFGGDRNPAFAVDPVTNRVFHRPAPNAIAAYSF